MGKPLVLTDNVQAYSSSTTASMLTARRYRCVWFDEVAALFVHEAYAGVVAAHPFDFAAWHFARATRPEPADAMAERMLAKTSWNLLHNLMPPAGTPRPGGTELARKLIWAGLDHARALQRLEPSSGDGWKWAGMIEADRDLAMGDPIPRFKMPFDPVFDLSDVRATADLRRARELSPRDANVHSGLFRLAFQRGMYATALEVLDGLLALPLSQSHERQAQEQARSVRPETVARLGEPPASLKWANFSDLHGLLDNLYSHGRAAEAADLLESAYPADVRPWEVWDRIATIRLHLGEPERAARLWAEAKAPPTEALRQARIGAARLAAGDFDGATTAYRAAIGADPKLFEAHYGLAVLEADAGHAREALEAAKAAVEAAPSATAKSAVAQLIQDVTPFAQP
jgi:tetratricopeptide (TPR) repeat protein